MSTEGALVAVCGRCNVAIELHPVKHCPLIYKPVWLNGRRYGWRMEKKSP